MTLLHDPWNGRAFGLGLLTLGLAIAGAPREALAQAGADAPRPAVAAEAPLALDLPVQRAQLGNGLRVVLSVDRAAPVVAVAVTYDVGSRDDPQGRSGLAHLIGRILLEGGRNAPRGEARRLVEARGGTLEAGTFRDSTRFVQVLPSGEFALGLWLEADRMRSRDIDPETFERQRRAALEECRGRVEGAPRAAGARRLEELVFQGSWPYAHPTLGTAADLAGIPVEAARDLRARYGPERAVVSVVGDIDPGAALALVRRTFEGIPRAGAAPAAPAPLAADAPQPAQADPRAAAVQDAAARAPGLLYGWPAPPLAHPDRHALAVAAILLGGGDAARLSQVLVRERGLAHEVWATLDARRGPGLFAVEARLGGGASIAEAQKLIEGEIAALADRGPAEPDLARARRRAQAALVADLGPLGARAARLGEVEMTLGDARRLGEDLARYAAVTREDVQRAVRTHLAPARRSLVETRPIEQPATGATRATPREGTAP